MQSLIVIKFKNKISRLTAYFALLSFLTITTANVFHHHNIELGKLVSFLDSSEKNQSNHISFIGSGIFCVVQFAFSSLNNSILSFENPTKHYLINSDVFVLTIVSSKPTKEILFSFCLRAPPFSIS
jgi:hypothetical protein